MRCCVKKQKYGKRSDEILRHVGGNGDLRRYFALAWKRIQALNAARAFVAGVGGVSYRPAKMLWAGGISTVEFTTTPPPGWRRDGSPLANMYRPDSTPEGCALYERIQRLPRVGRNEVNALVGYTDYFAGCRVEVEANVKS